MSSEHLDAPLAPDWSWPGTQSLKSLAELAVLDSPRRSWIRQLWAWLHRRMPEARRAHFPVPLAGIEPNGPPAGVVPILAAADDDACIGFLRVSSSRERLDGSEIRDDREAVRTARAVHERVCDELHFSLDDAEAATEVQLAFSTDADGASVGLSALVASLAGLLGLTVPGDLAATGAFDRATGRFAPVEPATITVKARCAAEWGYTRLLVVEGQSCPGVGTHVKIHMCPAEVPKAIVYALRLLLEHEHADLAAARALAVLDQCAVGARPSLEREQIMAVTEPFVAHSADRRSLAAHFAHDMRSRAALHAGRTGDAEVDVKSATAARPPARDIPAGWLGFYLRYEQPAHHAVLAIDRGTWSEDAPEHQRLREIVRWLDQAEKLGVDGLDERMGGMFLRNTAAMRSEFEARWSRSSEGLERAWTLRMHHRDDWAAIFSHCERLGIRDTTKRRQHNSLIDTIESHYLMSGSRLPSAWPGFDETFVQLWPAGTDRAEIGDSPFDRAAWLRYRAMADLRDHPDTLAAIDEMIGAGGLIDAFPQNLPFEAVLRHELGTPDQRERCRDRLADSFLLRDGSGPPDGILRLVALRTHALVIRAGGTTAAMPPRPGDDIFPKLAERYHELERGRPDEIILRCPY